VTEDTTPTHDLTGCPGTGLIDAAPDITLDLGGHTVSGASTAATASLSTTARASRRRQRRYAQRRPARVRERQLREELGAGGVGGERPP
jgi:hypothetical protein